MDNNLPLLPLNSIRKADGRIHGGRFDYSAGGVGRNICEALDKLECPSYFISAVGDDHQGQLLLQEIPKESHDFIAKLPQHNTAQCIVVVNSKGECCFLMGDMHIHEQISIDMIETHEALIKDAPLIVIDGNISTQTMDKILETALKHNVPVFYEPTDVAISRKPFKTKNWKAIKFISPNLAELHDIAAYLQLSTSVSSSDLEQVAEVAQGLTSYVDNVLVTLGSKGILVARKGDSIDPLLNASTFARKASVRHYPIRGKDDFINVSGAGDCFASGFIAALLQNCSESQCVSVGFAAALAALHSQSPVPKVIFNKQHKSWLKEAEFIALC